MKIWEAISSFLNVLRQSVTHFLVNYNLFSHHIPKFYVTDGENVYSETPRKYFFSRIVAIIQRPPHKGWNTQGRVSGG